MAYPELVSYIARQTLDGTPAEILRQSLMEVGWHELDVENALHDVAAGLAPLTDGSSLHEDVSQVRSMVAHLASRVKAIESQLSIGTLGPDRMLSPARRRLVPFLPLLIAGAVIVGLGRWAIGLDFSRALAPLDQAIISGSVGFLMFIIGYVAMRIRCTGMSSLAIGAAIAVWGLTILVAWSRYEAMEWSTALALGALLVVLAFVMGRWIGRPSR